MFQGEKPWKKQRAKYYPRPNIPYTMYVYCMSVGC